MAAGQKQRHGKPKIRRFDLFRTALASCETGNSAATNRDLNSFYQGTRNSNPNRQLVGDMSAEISGSSQKYLSGLERGQRNPIIVNLYESCLGTVR